MSECPVMHGHPTKADNQGKRWWPNQLNLGILKKNPEAADPMEKDFDYGKEFLKLDLDEVRKDIVKLMNTSQDWWPADFGHYGPFFIRMSWHSAGTYRIQDGRGGAGMGMQRFAPLNSWPDNVNLDKARRLLWPIKQKYGKKLSWADLMIFAGNCALDDMGFKTLGFAGGRPDVWEPSDDVYWGPETEWLDDKRYTGDRELENPLAAVQMGLIYVNPEGPNGEPDPLKSAYDIRDTFGKMAMNDVETVALIVGGHTFGKTHGAAPPDDHVGPEPEGADMEDQQMGWNNSFGTGKGRDTIGSGLEVTWTSTPTKWSNKYLENLFGFEWELTKSPAGAYQWKPKDGAGANTVPDPEDGKLNRAPTMLTSDIALREDPAYEKISRDFLENPKKLEEEFAKAWFKLTHRDMGPIQRYLGKEVPSEEFIWQDPLPKADGVLVGAADIDQLKQKILASGLSVSSLVSTAWAAASTFRCGDKRGGANGARIRFSPQKEWKVNDPEQLDATLKKLEEIRSNFNSKTPNAFEKIRSSVTKQGQKSISLADMIVLGGCTAIEKACKDAGFGGIKVPFTPGRTDATEEMTDADSFTWLEPKTDGFRNYLGEGEGIPAEFSLVDRANQLSLTPPQMTVLVGGLRVLGANSGGSKYGVFTDKVGVLSNDFFTNLLNHDIKWTKSSEKPDLYEGCDRTSGKVLFQGTRNDLVFGSNSELRALAEVYASNDAKEKFAKDFVKAWDKVMMLDRYDL